MSVSKEKLERITFFRPAFDKRHKDPSKNYGIHGMDCVMVLKGKKGAVHFVWYTGILLPETTKEQIKRHGIGAFVFKHSGEPINPMGADVGYHSPTPRYEGQTSNENCEYLNGKPCYTDGSGLRAKKFMEILIREGSDKIWEMLEEDYQEYFVKET